MLLVSALVACGGSAPSPSPSARPAVEVVGEAGLKSLLAEKPEKLRVVNFWAMWCQPCVAELPELAGFARAHPEVELVLVNVDLPSQRGRIAKFAADHQAGDARVVALDSPDPVGALPRIVPDWPDAIPVTWAIRPDGTVAARYDRAVEPADLARMVER